MRPEALSPPETVFAPKVFWAGNSSPHTRKETKMANVYYGSGSNVDLRDLEWHAVVPGQAVALCGATSIGVPSDFRKMVGQHQQCRTLVQERDPL